MVRIVGLEPTQDFSHCHLKAARLPFRHIRIIEALSQPTAHLLIAGIFAFPIRLYFAKVSGMRAFF